MYVAPGFLYLGVLGQGGMGIVYKAKQELLNREVALKMISAGGLATNEQRRRFHYEAEAAAKLPDAIEKTVQDMIAKAKEEHRKETSGLIVPGQ